MAYGSGGNGRNGRSSRAAQRFTQPVNGSDSWREELKALQQRARSRSRRQRQKPRSALRAAFLTMIVIGLGFAGLGVMAILGGMHMASSAYASINRDLPSLNQIAGRETFKTAQLYDRKGRLLWEFFDPDAGRRTVVPISEISQYLIDATLAAEDANFYSNPGIEPKGIARAFYQNLAEQDIVSGASTITQQLVKNVLIPEDERYQQTPMRKIREALLAYQLTQKVSKSQILTLYLNEIFYGNQTYGIEAASQGYFGKHARDLTLAEASMLAGLPQSPAVYNPLRNAVAAKARQAYVLEQMVRHGFITEAEANAASQAELRYQPQKQPFLAPHWAVYIRSQIEEKYGTRMLYQGGLKIYTSLDFDLQTRMEEVALANKPNLDQRDAENTSIVVMNPKTGEVLAMVGSMDYWNTDIEGQVNVAVSERQPGSTIKPLVYLSAFTKGWTPGQMIVDEKLSIKDELGRTWEPENYDKRFHGNVTARIALGNSLNIPAVKTIQFAGVESVAELARRMGITTWTDNRRLGLAMSLGGAEVRPLDMTAAYTVLANNGLRIPQVSITKIVDAEGNTLEEYKVPQGEQIVDPRYAYMVTSILSDNNARLITYGPNSMLKLTRPGAAKTGTTDSYRDTWTMGYTPNLTVGVWVGNTDNRPMKEVLSSMSAGKIWREAMDTSLDYLQLPPDEFTRPPGLVDVQICTNNTACVTDLYPAESVPRGGRVVQPGATPSSTAAPAPAPAAPAPAVTVTVAPSTTTTPEAAEAAEGEPGEGAQPTPTAPGLIPGLPILQPRRTPGPPPQATPRPADTAPANRFQPTAAPAQPTAASKPQQPNTRPQPTPAPKPQATPTPRRR
ncbi:MAG: PBP1A family penicillin-binding protein [Chloroflexi bacterium]|nr:PBP1A family penicillin-binding protein [Chloroflexota bacterium]